jgi:hypothetical protein
MPDTYRVNFTLNAAGQLEDVFDYTPTVPPSLRPSVPRSLCPSVPLSLLRLDRPILDPQTRNRPKVGGVAGYQHRIRGEDN